MSWAWLILYLAGWLTTFIGLSFMIELALSGWEAFGLLLTGMGTYIAGRSVGLKG